MILYLKDAKYVENIILTNKKISIVIEGKVLEEILINIKNKVLETGGILYGFKLKENEEYILFGITEQQEIDKATYCSYNRLDPNHLNIVNNLWKENKAIRYLGDWHYHPVEFINPSSIDYQTFKKNTKESRTDSKFLFYIIVGKQEFKLFIYEKKSAKLLDIQKISWDNII